MLIRRFRSEDAGPLAALFHASVHAIGRRHYSAEQVAAWSPAPPSADRYVAQAEHSTIFVAEDNAGQPAGYAVLDPGGHIDHLYCRPDWIGNGVGSALYGSLEDAARGAGIVLLFVEASEGARHFFERRGFIVAQRHEFELAGVKIHNYRMSKSLR